MVPPVCGRTSAWLELVRPAIDQASRSRFVRVVGARPAVGRVWLVVERGYVKDRGVRDRLATDCRYTYRAARVGVLELGPG